MLIFSFELDSFLQVTTLKKKKPILSLTRQRQKVLVHFHKRSHVFSHGKVVISVISISWQTHKRRKRRWPLFFFSQNTLTPVQRLASPFPSEQSDDSFCPRSCVSPFFLWHGESTELLSCVRGAWTAAKPVRGSSYFDTLKHLPSPERGGERHAENNRDRASFQPRLHRPILRWLPVTHKARKVSADPLPSKASGEHAP